VSWTYSSYCDAAVRVRSLEITTPDGEADADPARASDPATAARTATRAMRMSMLQRQQERTGPT
jgi:hypothetical protein